MNDLEKRFTYHEPTEDKGVRFVNIRNSAKSFAYIIDNVCPDGREKSLAMTRLEEAVMWANASVARMEEEE